MSSAGREGPACVASQGTLVGRGPCTQQDFQARPPLVSGPHGLAWVPLGAELTRSRRPCDKQGSLTAPDLGIKEGGGVPGSWLE